MVTVRVTSPGAGDSCPGIMIATVSARPGLPVGPRASSSSRVTVPATQSESRPGSHESDSDGELGWRRTVNSESESEGRRGHGSTRPGSQAAVTRMSHGYN